MRHFPWHCLLLTQFPCAQTSKWGQRLLANFRFRVHSPHREDKKCLKSSFGFLSDALWLSSAFSWEKCFFLLLPFLEEQMGVDCPDVGVLMVKEGLLPLEPCVLWPGSVEPEAVLFGVFGLALLAAVGALLFNAHRKLLLFPWCLTVLLHVLQVTISTPAESLYFLNSFASLKLSISFLASRLRSFCIFGVSLALGLRRTLELSRTNNWKQCGHVSWKVLLSSTNKQK